VAFALPMNLVEAARRDPVPESREWVDGLPEVVDELAGRGHFAWVNHTSPAASARG
jgi:hypothetical protein